MPCWVAVPALFAALTLLFGIKPLIFASGSMGPGIPTGALGLAIATPAAEVVPGQVVSVVTSDGTRVTHRVVSKSPDGGLILKGDANAVADLQPYKVQTVDRLLFSVPVLGFVASALGQPWVYFLGGLLCAVLVYVAFLRRDTRTEGGTGSGAGRDTAPGPGSRRSYTPGPDSRRPGSQPSSDPLQRRADWGRYSALSVPAEIPAGGSRIARRLARRRTLQGTVAVLAALAIVVPAGLAVRAEPTRASFTGSAAAKGSLTAATMPMPEHVKCAKGSDDQTIMFTWDPPAAGVMASTGYNLSVQVNNSDGSPSATNKISAVQLGTGVMSYSLDINNSGGLLGALLGLLGDLLIPYNYTATVKISATYPNGWSSAPVVFNQVNATNGGLLGPAKKLTCTLQ